MTDRQTRPDQTRPDQRHTSSTAHHWRIRVYYEDTDLAGIVYYANYLRFIERGRTEMLRDAGFDQAALRRDAGIAFAVRRVEADYLSSARFDDLLEVRTAAVHVTGARIVLQQDIFRIDAEGAQPGTSQPASPAAPDPDARLLLSSRVTLVTIDEQGRAARIPADIRRHFA